MPSGPWGQNCSWFHRKPGAVCNRLWRTLQDVLTTKSEFLCEELPLFIKINPCAYSPIIKTGLTACVLTQSCTTLCDPLDCSPPGSSVHGILQARILEWVAMPFSRGSSQSRHQTCVSYLLHWQADSLPLAPSGSPRTLWLRANCSFGSRF